MKSQDNIRYSFLGKMLEVAGIASLIAIVFLPLINYAGLPDEIPSHFNFKGLPDAWSSKSSIWALPIIAAVLYIGLSALNFFLLKKQIAKNSGNNNPAVLGQVLRLMQTLKLSLNIGFLYIVYATIQVSHESFEGLGLWFLPVYLMVMIILPLIFIVKIAGISTTKSGK